MSTDAPEQAADQIATRQIRSVEATKRAKVRLIGSSNTC